MPTKSQTPPESDRRHGTRVRCGGLAKIVPLPSQGLFVPGKILNLSEGGCGVELVLSLPVGTRAEFVLHVNAASIRVLGEIREPRGANVVGVEFVRVSAGGKYLLDDLIQHLLREQALAALRKTGRNQSDRDRILQTESAFWHDWRDVPPQVVRLHEAADLPIEPRDTESHIKSIATLVNRELDLFI